MGRGFVLGLRGTLTRNELRCAQFAARVSIWRKGAGRRAELVKGAVELLGDFHRQATKESQAYPLTVCHAL